jgi:hypothetical protein
MAGDSHGSVREIAFAIRMSFVIEQIVHLHDARFVTFPTRSCGGHVECIALRTMAPPGAAVRAPSADTSPPPTQASNGQVIGADQVPPGDKLAMSVRITPEGILPASQPIATTGVGRTPPPNAR